MSTKRFSALCLTVGIVLPTLMCTDQAGVVSPVDPQFAKKVKPPPAEPVLEEFWVYRDALSDCPGEIIHIVVSGDFQYIGTTIAHDHFFNGVRDLGFHFEYGFRGPEYPETDWNDDGTEGHIDVCFQGEQIDHIYGDGSGGLEYFADYPSTSVGGTGADPFAISFGAVINDGPRFETRGFRPAGVVEGGETGTPETGGMTSSWHPYKVFDNVRSYAVWNSTIPPAGYLFFNGIAVTNASCLVSTEVVGKGKNKTEVTTTTVTAEVNFDYEAEDLPGSGLTWDQDYWGDGHLRIVSEGNVPLFISDGYRTRSEDGTDTYTWSIEEDLSGLDGGIEFLADFLIAQAAASMWEEGNIHHYVYDPGRNHPSLGTTAGFDGDPWHPDDNVSRSIYDPLFPVAHSNRFPVTCGGG